MPVNNYVDNENWPPTWSLCRLQGQLLNADGSPANGSVWLKPVPVAVHTDSHIILPRSIEVELDGDGSFDQYVPATDDPDINPSEWNYRVTERVSNGRTYYINAPGGTTLNLADAAPVPSSPGNAVTYSSEVSSDDGNVLTIGSDGLPYADAGDLGGGVSDHGDLTGLADDDHTQYHNNTRGDARYFTQAQVTASLATKSDTSHSHGTLYYTEAEVDALFTAHIADTTSVHGIANTANLVLTSDSRLTDSRDPTNHAGDHELGGVDEIGINASQTVAGVFTQGRLGSGSGDATKFLRGDSTWVASTPIRAVQGTQPSTTGWATNDFWYDTSTE